MFTCFHIVKHFWENASSLLGWNVCFGWVSRELVLLRYWNIQPTNVPSTKLGYSSSCLSVTSMLQAVHIFCFAQHSSRHDNWCYRITTNLSSSHQPPAYKVWHVGGGWWSGNVWNLMHFCLGSPCIFKVSPNLLLGDVTQWPAAVSLKLSSASPTTQQWVIQFARLLHKVICYISCFSFIEPWVTFWNKFIFENKSIHWALSTVQRRCQEKNK